MAKSNPPDSSSSDWSSSTDVEPPTTAEPFTVNLAFRVTLWWYYNNRCSCTLALLPHEVVYSAFIG